MAERFFEFETLFNKQQFFEAHEVLEQSWREEKSKGPAADLVLQNTLQGLIQIAASLVHVQRRNFAGAARVLDSAAQYLQCSGKDFSSLIKQTRACIEQNANFPTLKL